ncbi:hypothetical protein HNY73_005413 [Argiope bruennichi]|uniref:Uncharacterized protein n=1 Tax=Argiope bruennichi TaxID=94029 RepID=A0A8T0FJI9_ARGBR|nr:hypothetical protein HNY73_005413 [Argiope bruennichi]
MVLPASQSSSGAFENCPASCIRETDFKRIFKKKVHRNPTIISIAQRRLSAITESLFQMGTHSPPLLLLVKQGGKKKGFEYNAESE